MEKDRYGRLLDTIYVMPIYSKTRIFMRFEEAAAFIRAFSEKCEEENIDFMRYEIIIRFQNQDWDEMSFRNRRDAISHLELLFGGV